MKLPQLLCLAGNAGVGKDTLADYLVREHGYVKYRFADPLKKLLMDRFGWKPEQLEDRKWKEEPQRHCGSRQLSCYPLEDFSPRSWMQWLGTEVGRTIGGPDVWVNAMWKSYRENHWGQRMVVCDARFDNEAASFWVRGGDVLHIWRGAAPKVLDHASERGISEEYWSCEVENNGTIEEFLARSLEALQRCASAR